MTARLSDGSNYAFAGHSPVVPLRQIRATYDEQVVTVYQAYSNVIADSALRAGTFVSPPFKLERMTWIKPSFLWMMYRAGWGFKDDGQNRILAIDITRTGFEWALTNSCPTHMEDSLGQAEWKQIKATTPVRIQWDPERDLLLQPLNHRAIQIGLGKHAVELYISEWIKSISDVTPLSHSIYHHVERRDFETARRLLPLERPYQFLSDHKATEV